MDYNTTSLCYLRVVLNLNTVGPTVSPTSQVCYLNKTATFHCNGRLGGPGWNLNSTPLHLQGGSYNTNITGLTLTLECSLKLNNSEVTCYDYSNPGLASEPAQLKVQGSVSYNNSLLLLLCMSK